MTSLVAVVEQVAQSPSASAVVANIVFYFGLVLLFGMSVAGVWVFRPVPPRLLRALPAVWLLAAAGAIARAEQGRRALDVGLGAFISVPLGRAALWRGIGLLVAHEGMLVALLAKGRARRFGFGLLGAGALVAAVGHALSSHGGAGGWTWLKISEQGAHIAAVGVWIGGLAVLLAGIREGGEDTAGAARRFSVVAGGAIFVVAASGFLRSSQELGSLSALIQTGYGRLVIFKFNILIALAILGSINRYRHVPEAGRTLTGLRRVGRAEIAIALAAFAATGFLSGTVPGREVIAQERAEREKAQITVTEIDDLALYDLKLVDGTAIQAYADPGAAGANEVHLTFFDAAGAELAMRAVSARAVAGTKEVTLAMRKLSPGHFVGRALLTKGRWRLEIEGKHQAGTIRTRYSFEVR